MAHEARKLAIFRGLLQFKSNEQKIWVVLAVLSVITVVEVTLGIVRPDWSLVKIAGMKFLNWIFIILTLAKAYYISWDFMHLRDERKGFRMSVVLSLLILIPYLTLILLLEGDYLYRTFKDGFMGWDF